MDYRHAEPQRWVGFLRRRQHALLLEPHSVCRSRRATRPANRRCQRPLPRVTCPARLRRGPPRRRRCRRLSVARAGSRRQLVRTLGTNYIYGTWSVLAALNAAGIDPAAPELRRAVDWLLTRQRADGGWGEREESYWPGVPRGQARSE